MKGNSQSRKWQLTINNPEDYNITREALIASMEEFLVDYYCMCDEVSDTGTPHTHVFFYSRSPKRFQTIKNRFPTAHIEKAIASCTVNRDYVMKAGKWEDDHKAHTKVEGSFYEQGILPSEREEKHPERVELISRIKDGADLVDLVEEFPELALRTRNLTDLQNIYITDQNEGLIREVTTIYIYSPGGLSGMPIICSENDIRNICRITNYNMQKGTLFDAYHGQPVLVFDHFTGDIPLGQMIMYLEPYPLYLPARYGDKIAQYNKVYIVSNLQPRELYGKVSENNRWLQKTFLSKIGRVISFTEDGEIVEGLL